MKDYDIKVDNNEQFVRICLKQLEGEVVGGFVCLSMMTDEGIKTAIHWANAPATMVYMGEVLSGSPNATEILLKALQNSLNKRRGINDVIMKEDEDFDEDEKESLR